ncbi:MAG: ChaN family lipoprotein [Thermodesulfobacteriota bacterium]
MKLDSVVLLFSSFFAVILLASPVFAGPPRLDLTVSFVPERHLLQGVARFVHPGQEVVRLRADGMTIDALRLDGISHAAEIGADGILVLPAAPRPQQVEITFAKEYAAKPAGNSMVDRQGIVLLDSWYPLLPWEAVISLTAEIPAGFSAISEADEISYAEQGPTRRVSFRFDHPLPFVHFVAGPYEVSEETLPGGAILATYFFPEDRQLAATYGAKAKAYLARYQELIGPYPFKRYSVVENRLPTGYAMPTFTLLGQSVVRLPFISDTSLGHEVLHSWFGNAVGVDPAGGNWCEGLTTYLADQAYAEEKGEGVDFRKNQLVRYQGVVATDNTMAVKDFRDAADYGTVSLASRAVGYNKVSMIFHMLRLQVGDEAFFAALRAFYAEHRFRDASWDDLARAFAAAAGQDLTGFFAQWLKRADVPRLAVDKLRLTIKDGNPELGFELVQENTDPYRLTVPVRITVGSEVVEQAVAVDQARTPVVLSFPAMPTELVVDPDYSLMRELAADELPPVWARFQGGGNQLAVLEDGQEEVFAAFLPLLAEMGCQVVSETELDDKELAGRHILFLGTSSKAAVGLFAVPDLPVAGFTVAVRNNPLSPDKVAVLVKAAAVAEVEAAARKLRHYGKYGYLHFVGGTIQDKRIPSSRTGLVRQLDQPPRGAAVEKSLDFAAIMDLVAESRVVYVGETHVNQADHILQYRVLQALHARHPELAIGMEMFNRSVQPALDAYINGEIDERQFLKDARYFKNWGYDYRFYRDILQFARVNRLPVIALNLDKDVVSATFKGSGIAGLPEEMRQSLPLERDLAMDGYRERLLGVFAGHSGAHFTEDKVANFVQAQVLWDETMAETAADFLASNPQKKMLVIAGSGHVVKNNAIPPRLARRLDDVSQSVILNAREGGLAPEDADYVFFSPPAELSPQPMLGVMLEEKEKDIVVAGFAPNGGAEKAGMRKNDVILAVDGHAITEVEDIKIALLYKEHGGTVTVRVRRPVPLLPDALLEYEVAI